MQQSIEWIRTRPPVAGRHGAVACAHPLASLVGLDMLRSGGNAIDAVIAMAATLGVVEPYMSGPGGVGWLLFHPANGQPRTLNFGGNTPAGATLDKYPTREHTDFGPRACMIPGNVAGWFEALRTYGTKRPSEIFTPAVKLAEEGFPLHPFNVKLIELSSPRLNAVGKKVYGEVPRRVGAILRQPELAATYRQLIADGPDVFYRGVIAERIVDCLQSQGGVIDQADLAGYRPDWEPPIAVNYRGLEVRTCPPNNEGFQILQTLKLLEAFDLRALGHHSPDYIHVLSEAIKLARADRTEWNCDPKFFPVPLDRLLSDGHLTTRRALINLEMASRNEVERWGERAPDAVVPGKVDGQTTHMAAVDEQGNVASITQSLGNGFGCGVMVPGTGITLNNFIWWTEARADAPERSRLQPGKRWSSCMAPVHVLRDGRFWFSISTPGSWGILQTTLQMLLNIVEFDADVQLAIEAPRFRVWENTRIQIEDRVSRAVRDELAKRGHVFELAGYFSHSVGGGHAVLIDPESGSRLGGADPRRDGYALAY